MTYHETISVETDCKFCGQMFMIEINRLAVQKEIINVDTFKALAACDRCADFHTKRLTLEETICRRAMSYREVDVTQEDKPKQVLEKLTIKYSDLICDMGCTDGAWEPEFLAIILSNPRRTLQHLHHFWMINAGESFRRWNASRQTTQKNQK